MGEHVHVLEDGTVVKHSHTHTHENTKAVINRLSRAIGHLESIRRMVEEGRDCSEVLIQLSAVKSAINNTGKTIAVNIPRRRLPENALETNPTRVGPPEHPKSPASASIANRTVPPLFIAADALLKVPGHIIPTENPQIAQPISPTIGTGTREMHKYEATHSTQLPFINRSKLSFSPYFP